jgi:phenylacetate-coenzyme A ligase PaaK-like adenylate-forming protein
MEVSFGRRVALSAHALVRFVTEPRVPYHSMGAIERAQRRRLRATIAHAIEHVPHYREACRRLGLGPGDFRSAADLAKLPLIEREDLQRDPEYFVSQARPLNSYTQFHTGGSTGRPVRVFFGARDLVDQACVGARGRPASVRAVGKRSRVRVAAILPPESNTVQFAEAVRRSLIVPYDPRTTGQLISLSEDPGSALEAINEYRPDVVGSYGSYIEALFTHAVRSGRPFHRPKLVTYGGDSISPGARKMLLEDLGIEVLSAYQAIETPQVGFECEQHRGYHLNVDVCPVRVVDDAGRELPGGESGEVVISDLTSRGTVLLNYRLGDVATALPEPCDCGRALPLLSYPQVRRGDWAKRQDGRLIHPALLARPLSLDDEVWGYQIEQLAPGRFAALLLPAAGADGETVRARVRERFASIVGPDVNLEISLVDSLPRTSGGKVKRVVRAGDSA